MIANLLFIAMLGGPGPAGPAPVQDPLVELNAAFRACYAEAKTEPAAVGGPVLVVDGDRLRLFRDGVPVPGREALIRPPAYHRLKAVAHVPLALHLLLAAPGDPSPAGLERIRALAAAARAGLGKMPQPVLVRQRRILDACVHLLDQRLAGPLPPGRLAAFAADMGPLLLANAEEAAGLELEALDREVAGIRRGLAPGDWKALRVLILGSHMAREGEVSLQFFTRLLGEPGEGGRIIYAEGLWNPADALALLATHRVDQGASAAFFGDPMRLHRDILEAGARKWMENHPMSQ